MWVVRGCSLSSHTRNQVSSILFCHHHNLWQVERENERKNLAFKCLGLEIKYVASTLNSLACASRTAPNWIPGRLGIVEEYFVSMSGIWKPTSSLQGMYIFTKNLRSHWSKTLLSICNHPRGMDILTAWLPAQSSVKTHKL